MAENVQEAFEQAITPQVFIERMTRNQDKFLDWGQRFAWSNEEDKRFFETFRNDVGIRCLIIAADWCGDVVRNVPVLLKLMEAAHVDTRMLIMEEHLDVMDRFLTLGGRSIPVVLLLNASGDVLAKWGPRPEYVQQPMLQFKQGNPDKSAPDYEDKLKAARTEVMARYGEDTGYQTLIVKELRGLLEASGHAS